MLTRFWYEDSSLEQWDTIVELPTDGFDWGQGLILKEHEVPWLDITMQNPVCMTLCNGPQHSSHVASHLQSQDTFSKHFSIFK